MKCNSCYRGRLEKEAVCNDLVLVALVMLAVVCVSPAPTAPVTKSSPPDQGCGRMTPAWPITE